jgi:hypothetical protein
MYITLKCKEGYDDILTAAKTHLRLSIVILNNDDVYDVSALELM